LSALGAGTSSFSFVTLAETAPPRAPGPGTDGARRGVSGRPSFRADLADLVLEELAQRLDEFEAELRGKPADIVMRLLIVAVGPPNAETDSMTSGVERALRGGTSRPFAWIAASRSLNTSMNAWPIALRLVSGSVDAAQPLEEERLGVGDDERLAETAGRKSTSISSRSPVRSRPVSTKIADELLAERAMEQFADDGRVDAAGEAAHHLRGNRPAS